MLIDGEEQIDDKSFFRKIPVEQLKQEALDNSFKKAENKNKPKKEIKLPKKKKPILKIGFILIIFGLLLIVILKTNIFPWMYISYDSNFEDVSYDNSYFSNFISNKEDINQTVEKFFSSENSSKLIGLSDQDFFDIPKISFFISIAIIILGSIFSILVIIDKKLNFPLINLYIFQTIFVSFLILIFIYFISILTKFLGGNISIILNSKLINKSLNNANIIFPIPIIVIVILSILMKLCFTVIKSNFKEINIIRNAENENLFLSFRNKKGGTKN